MYRLVAICSVVLGAVSTMSAQSLASAVADISSFTHIQVTQNDGSRGTAVIEVKQTDFYLGEPSASVLAEVQPGSSLRASRFTVRAWREGDKTRMVVYAVVSDKTSTRDIETPIAIYTLSPSDAARARSSEIVVTETAQWGAAPIVLRPFIAIRH